MRLLSWLRERLGTERRVSSTKLAKRRTLACRPRLELLEDRSLMTAGMLDPTFGTSGIADPAGKNFHGIAYGLAVYSNSQTATAGDIVAAGWIADKPDTDLGIARFTPGGKPDATFGTKGTVITKFNSYYASQGAAVAIQGDGKIVAAATAYPRQAGTSSDFALARYNIDGSLDTKFGSTGTVATNIAGGPTAGTADSARAVFIQPDGKIVVAGISMPGSPATTNLALVRYNANGSLDTSFGSAGEVITSHTVIPGSYVDPAGKYGTTSVSNAVLQPDGKILVSGYTEVTNGLDANPITYNTYEAFVLRYNANGSLDTSFGAAGAVTLPPQTDPDNSEKGTAGKLALTPSGEIVLAGFNQLALLHSDGSFDTSFASGGIASYVAGIVAVQPNGDILTASAYTGLVSRFLPDGTPDVTFGNGGTESPIVGSVTALAIQPDGKIDVASGFTIARLLPGEPVIGSFSASANTLSAGSSVTLMASNITDSNPGSTITQVAFYAQVNGVNTLLGYGAQSSPGAWTFKLTRPAGWAAGTYTLLAQATDNFGVLGEPLSLDLQVL
jgi:uncharacterized delta-60 repeat protein